MFAEADYGMTEFAFNQSSRGPGPGDDKLIVAFHLHPHPDAEKTKEEGRPIFTEREYITIMVPGDKNNIIRRPVWDMDRTRFPNQYQAFKNGQSQEQSGTPLEQVPWISRSQVEELKFFHVRTLENLSNIPDNVAQKFVGIHQLRQKAKDHIEAAKGAAPVAAMKEELRQRDERIAQQDAQLKELSAQVEVLMKKAK